ncbi:translesion error-prone DNA polymerase V autoproteolytic subunit [Candidatus Dojkabacteria bacterium]|nr:translesion error-prone DNA polymerase V autoproteolytic subunit [Candidatus Dojkabacteria bacterium]
MTSNIVLKQYLYSSPVSAGFPSPADDFIDKSLDISELLIKHPDATFFVRAEGYSMINAGIHPGDLLVVDRSLQPQNNSIVIACVDGEFTVKRLHKKDNALFLEPQNPKYKPTQITDSTEVEIWGVVVHVIHTFTDKTD